MSDSQSLSKAQVTAMTGLLTTMESSPMPSEQSFLEMLLPHGYPGANTALEALELLCESSPRPGICSLDAIVLLRYYGLL